MKIKSLLSVLIVASSLLMSSLSFAGADTETDANGVILAGHDVVAYFADNAAVEGSANFTSVHNHFSYFKSFFRTCF